MKIKSMLIAALLAGGLAACNRDGDGATLPGGDGSSAATDKFTMISPNEAPLISKDKRAGTVKVTEDKNGTTILVNVTTKNLLPAGELGVTINENGSCRGANFAESGGHYNPGKREHGPNNPKGFHLGDIGNAFSSIGNAQMFKYTATISGLGYRTKQPRGALMDTNGFAIVVHEKKDDLKTIPNGGMGKAVACAAFKP